MEPSERLSILILVTWYAPHLSGLTIAVRRLAEGFRARGHSVTVLTSRHADHLASQEIMAGVTVLRFNPYARLSKGFLLPNFPRTVLKLCDSHDLVVGVLPAGPFECLALRLAAQHRPTVIEYICDIRLPGGWPDRLIERATRTVFRWAAQPSSAVVFSSSDYAATSPFSRYCGTKVRVASYPISVPAPDPAEVARLRSFGVPGSPIIGMAGRLAYGKGFELLLEAFPYIRHKFPNVRVLCAGEHTHVVGEEAYRRRILPRIQALGDDWRLLGVLQPSLASFFAACDVLAFPSTNRTDSFGMVQAEAMMCGTPVVATDLPGIRVAVQTTGMGKLFPAGDVSALGESLVEVLENRDRYVKAQAHVRSHFSEDIAVRTRLEIYSSIATPERTQSIA